MENRAEQRACEAIGNACHSNVFNYRPATEKKKAEGRGRKMERTRRAVGMPALLLIARRTNNRRK